MPRITVQRPRKADSHAVIASMRPRLNAADYAGGGRHEPVDCACFNEAAAECRGLRQLQIHGC